MKYLPTIGIETHVQLRTETKLFAAVGNDAREAEPNSLISHICVGLPGALPVLNEQAVALSTRAALALNTRPQKFSYFERKHYFYPDLPKGYQITQYTAPIIRGGYVEIQINGKIKKIGIERANLEEDAGKNTHPAGADYSLVDLNRAGTPLLEIVSQPELNSAAEAKAYVRELWLLMRYGGVTDGDLFHGHVRFDINVSLSSQPDQLGTRSEIKNLNSFRAVEAAVAYEIKRQTELLDKDRPVIQETRGWDEAKQKSISQRGKEEAQDYRYMPEPDVPPLELEEKYDRQIAAKMPLLPAAIRKKLNMLSIDSRVIEDILDQPEIVPRVLDGMAKTKLDNARRIVFQLLENPQVLKLELADQITVAEMAAKGELSSTAAKALIAELVVVGGRPKAVAKKLGLAQISDESQLTAIVEQVIADNPKVAADIRAGQTKAIGWLIGQVMTISAGQANPALAKQLIEQRLRK
ncbi:Asp-tRNA(Asn)/Glu-tRNA(Gln) amidotransferase subunit GatB [Candidatus Saccharibacteria bacterium]|nr:Asp-tRNA(Asn)/Glu-tRNA(Gln) amidotransferase subunit GatB [Candidatus Saccharibacteria bacterium]